MFFNNDKKQIRELETKIAENQKLYRRVFESPDGIAILDDLKKRCFINQTTFNDNHGQMSFNEGRRSIYVYITNLIGKDIKGILEELTKGE